MTDVARDEPTTAPTSPQPGSVLEQLLREGQQFEFFQAVRLLSIAAAIPSEGRRPIGYDESPAREVARICVHPSLSFPASQVVKVSGATQHTTTQHDATRDNAPPRITIAFMGMTGPCGVLPSHYTQLIIERQRKKDTALRDFLDLFHHRLVSMFYRVWEKYHFPIAFEQAQLNQRVDLYSLAIDSVIGMGTAKTRERLEVPHEVFRYFAGVLQQRPANAVTLEQWIEDVFGLPAEVEQFVGQWLYLDACDQTAMPDSANRDGWNTQLGVAAIAGDRVWSQDTRFRVRLGPMSYPEFLELTPQGQRLPQVGQLVRAYAGNDLDFEIQPVLFAHEIPACQLTDDAPKNLGWDTWLITEPRERDGDESIFEVSGIPG